MKNLFTNGLSKVFMGTLVAMVCFMGTSMVYAEANISDLVLHVEFQKEKEIEVSISAPLAIVQKMHEAMPKEIRNEFTSLGIDPILILEQFRATNGKDIVRMTGPESARIWLTEETEDAEEMKLIFINVNIIKEERNIELCLPVGLFEIASNVIEQLAEQGIIPVDDIVEQIQKGIKEAKGEK